MKKRLHILFMALLAMAVLGGCGADGTGESSEDTSSKEQNVQETEISEGPVYGGSVVVGIQQDIDSLDPHKATAAGTKEILFNVFEGLVKPDENGNLICAVASDYSISDDGLVYSFTLRVIIACNIKKPAMNITTRPAVQIPIITKRCCSFVSLLDVAPAL